MSILKTEIGTAIPNFLDSEVGLVTKTAQIPQSMGQTDGDRKTVFAGTVFPANTSAATGIVFQDVDVTDGDAIGAVMVAGRVISDRVNAASAAQNRSAVIMNRFFLVRIIFVKGVNKKSRRP